MKWTSAFLLILCSSAAIAQKDLTTRMTPREVAQVKEKRRKVVERDSVLQAFLRDSSYCDLLQRKEPGKFYYQGQQFISTYTMNRLIRRDISKITLDQEGYPVIGNYASLQYSDNNSKITLNTSLYNPFGKHQETDPIRNILSINIKAGVSDGIAPLFSDNNAANGAGIKLKWSFLSKKTLYEQYSQMNCVDVAFRRSMLRDNYEGAERLFGAVNIAKLREQNNKITVARKAINDYLKKFSAEQVNARRDSLKAQLLELTKERNGLPTALRRILQDSLLSVKERNELYRLTDSIKRRDLAGRDAKLNESLIAAMPSLTKTDSLKLSGLQLALDKAVSDYELVQYGLPKYDSVATIDSTYKLLYNMEAKNVRWDHFRVSWFDIDGGISGDKYKLFDKTALYEKQLSDTSFTTWTAGVTFNYFQSGRAGNLLKNGYFFQWSYAISNTNNLKGAETVDVTSSASYDSGTSKRQVSSKKTAYEAPFRQSYLHTIGVRFSAYQDVKQSTALNFYSTLGLGFNKDPLKIDKRALLLVGTGYTYALLNKDKEKAIINFELFLNFRDILNANSKSTKFYQRRDIGLKIGVPFNSIFINK